MDWSKELQSAQELQPSHRRYVYGTEDFIMKVALKPHERDYFGNVHDVDFTRLLDENLVIATEVVQKYTTIPVPKVVHYAEGMTVLEKVKGIDLDEAWDRVSPRQLTGIKLQLQEYIQQLWAIPNCSSDEFAVGTLCSTHELLFTCNRVYPHRGPFKTTIDYR